MLIKSVTLKNFRGYRSETTVLFSNLTTFVGRNDIGKSTILEALDIFFNEGKGCISLDKEDINKRASSEGDDEIIIAVEFFKLPDSLVIDDSNRTTLAAEYLLTESNTLKIVKRYPKAGREKVYIRAKHPTNAVCCDLLSKKITDLKTILNRENIECEDQTRKAVIRTAIWNHFADNLNLEEKEIDVTKEDGKTIWESLKKFLPVYSLFQADRSNNDHDKEIQDPLKEAVKSILKEENVAQMCQQIAEHVTTKLQEVSNHTLDKIREMNPELANSLSPNIPSFTDLKWSDLFKNVSIAGDNDIPINKRGSGVKRLILLNFFRAEAERMQSNTESDGLIYAIEEPETSQHVAHQKILMKALIDLANNENVQVVLTTHSSYVVKQLKFDNIRLVKEKEEDREERIVQAIEPSQLPYPSLNEINFTSFGEVTEEYHDELYSYLYSNKTDGIKWIEEYKNGKTTVDYIRELPNGTTKTEQKTLTEKIRHQIHHPENCHNEPYTETEIRQSIEDKRAFIMRK